MNTLMVHTGGIGDFILTCTAIEQLSTTQSITLAGNPDRLALAVDAGIAERALSLDQIRFDSLFSEPHAIFCEAVSNFDQIIIWMSDDDKKIATSLSSITDADIQVHPGLPPESWSRHASEWYLECLRLEATIPFRLKLPPCDFKLDIVIHPGSGAVRKNWPIENFRKLADRLEAEEREISWCLGPAETESEFPRLPGKVLVCDSLSDLALQLAAANYFVGNDSGITHLAAALGINTSAIFGPTDPDLWAPRGTNVSIHQEVNGRPSVESVFAQIRKSVSLPISSP